MFHCSTVLSFMFWHFLGRGLHMDFFQSLTSMFVPKFLVPKFHCSNVCSSSAVPKLLAPKFDSAACSKV